MKRLLFVIVMLLNTGTAMAAGIQDYAVVYDLLPSGDVQEQIAIAFSAPLNTTAQNFLKLGDSSGVRVFADSTALPVNTSTEGNDVHVSFATPAGTTHLLITLTAHSMIFRDNGIFQFYTELTPPQAGNVTLTAQLPKGFVLHRSFFPPGADVGTDGERIFFRWEFQGGGQPIPISIQYEPVFKTNQLLLPGVIAVAVIAVAAAFLYYRRASRRAFLKTFFEDEQKVIMALQTEKTSYQNTLERRFGFSRAKMTRIVQKLERKGLVKKERAGRTNRLHWNR